MRLTQLPVFPTPSWALDVLDTKEMLINKNGNHTDRRALGHARWKSLFLKPYSTISDVVIITLRSNSVDGRKQSWTVIPAVSLRE